MASGFDHDKSTLHRNTSGQHVVQCGKCPKEKLIGAKFYCYDCIEFLCIECKDSHFQSHNVVEYQGVSQLRLYMKPCEKCEKKTSKFCRDCKVSLCEVCATHLRSEHANHVLIDKNDLTEMREQCIDKITNIRHNIIHHCHNLRDDIENDIKNGKNQINEMRETANKNIEQLKNMIEKVKEKSHNEIQSLEKSLMHKLNHQKEILDVHMQYLYQTAGEFEDLKNCTTPESVIEFHKNLVSKTSNIPDLFKLRLPSLKSESCINIEDIEKHIGKITNTEPFLEELRVCQDHKIYCETKKKAQCIRKIMIKSSPSLRGCRHISLTDDSRFWVSDYYGNLMLADLHGNACKIEITKDKCSGFHAVAANGDLLCVNEKKKEILRMVKDDDYNPEQKAFIPNLTWKPVSIYCCKYSGDILIGSKKDQRLGARVTRFDKSGKQIQQILSPDYIVPHYLTENYNGDICVSDWEKCGVIVHNKLGEHRFTYTESHSYNKLYPSGICCDLFRNILVYDGYSKSVLILGCDGGLLSTFIDLQSEYCIYYILTFILIIIP